MILAVTDDLVGPAPCPASAPAQFDERPLATYREVGSYSQAQCCALVVGVQTPSSAVQWNRQQENEGRVQLLHAALVFSLTSSASS